MPEQQEYHTGAFSNEFKDLDNEFQALRLQDPGAASVGGSGNRAVGHVVISRLPLLGKTHASIGGGQIHVASVLGLRLSGDANSEGPPELVPGGLEAEAYRCCQLVEYVLKSCGAGWVDLMSMTLQVSDLNAEKFQGVERIIDAFAMERNCPPITKSIVGCVDLRLSAAVQLEVVALASTMQLVQLPPPPPPGLEKPPVETTYTQSVNAAAAGAPWRRKAAEAGDKQEVMEKDKAKPQVEMQAANVVTTLSEDAVVSEPEPEQLSKNITSSSDLAGNFSAVSVVEVSETEAHQANPQLQGLHVHPHDHFFRMQMLDDQVHRTIRIAPNSILCNRRSDEADVQVQNWPSIWSYTFDVDIVLTENSFINIGLVEWITTSASESEGGNRARTLAQLLRVSPHSEPCIGQHSSESPRQMMLGCRRGVKWYGEGAWEHLLRDDVCEGSQLRFLCEYCIGMRGATNQMRLWLQPSHVNFRRRGRQCIRFARPLFEWTLPPSGGLPGVRRPCSVWVPAVALYSRDDVVNVSWQGVRTEVD
jgi:enamine deaminase RidA (YjgF/YER057c/UK114 family)